MNYNEIVKVVNEQNWKFTQLIIGLSVGIIAFSLQGLSNTIESKTVYLMFISWGSFFVSFIIGLVRLHHLQSVTTRNAYESFQKEAKKENVLIDENRLRNTNKKSALLYRTMMFFFIVGILSFAIFKIINM